MMNELWRVKKLNFFDSIKSKWSSYVVLCCDNEKKSSLGKNNEKKLAAVRRGGEERGWELTQSRLQLVLVAQTPAIWPGFFFRVSFWPLAGARTFFFVLSEICDSSVNAAVCSGNFWLYLLATFELIQLRRHTHASSSSVQKVSVNITRSSEKYDKWAKTEHFSLSRRGEGEESL